MRIFPDFSCWSLRKKLVAIIMLSSIICLLISISILVGSSIASRYKNSLQDLSGFGDILAENSQAAIAFSDKAEATRLLETLQGHQEISAAWMVNGNGIVLASWSRHGVAGDIPADYLVQSRKLHSDFWAMRANLYMPVSKGTERVGHILLKADFTGQWRSMLTILEEGLAGAALALLFTIPFVLFFATTISRPVNSLSRIFRGVASDRHNPNGELQQLEKEKIRHDELGDLVRSFIAMHDAVNQKIL